MSEETYTIDHDFLGDLVNQEISAADTWMNADLGEEQKENLEYYYGEPYGNEEEGFSQIVTRDVLETVEGIMPELMKIFASSDQVVEFDPIHPGDEERADIEAKYINHVFMNRGSGYKVLYDWFKDALLMKNGIIKVVWEEYEQIQFRNYDELSEQEYEVLKAGESDDDELFAAEYEIESSEKYKSDGQTYYNCRVKISRRRGKPCIEVIPSEEFRIKERSSCIKDATFVAHKTEMTIGEVIEMGYDEDDVREASIQTQSVLEESGVPQARWSNPDETSISKDVQTPVYDKLIEVAEAYVRIFDPETETNKTYRCFQVGRKCLEFEEVDRVPFISLTPIMIPHKFTGLSVAELVKDIQEIRSTIFRQMLDNLALQNAGRYTAIEGQVNLQDLIDNRIGGIIRQKMPGAVQRLDTPDLSAFTLPVMDQLDLQKENRTGVSRMTAGLDENALTSHQTATAVNQVMTAAQGKILLIARNFAETGVKDLFLELYNLIRENQTTPDLVPVSGQYALINPSEWVDRYDMHVTVGIGNGNKDQQLMHLNNINQNINMLMQSKFNYLVTADNIFNLMSEMIKNSGYDNPVKFISNPAMVQEPEPVPNPDLINAQARMTDAETNKQKTQAELQLDGAKFQWEKKVNAAEVSLEATQTRPVGVGTGK